MACSSYLDAIGVSREHADIQRFEKGRPVFEQGKAPVAAFLICSGTVIVARLLEDGRRYVARFALAGDLIGLSRFERERFSAHALTPVEAFRINLNENGTPAAASAHDVGRLFKRTTSELDGAYSHMITLGQKRAEERVASFLIDFAERWRSAHGETREIPFPMNRRDIADYLGLTIETISRTMTLLNKQGLVAVYPNRYEIFDPKGLAAIGQA